MREKFTRMHEFYLMNKAKAMTKFKALQVIDNISLRNLGLVVGGSTSALVMQISSNAEGFTVENGVTSWVSIMGTFWTMITGNPLLSTIACGSIVFLAIKMWRAFRH